MAHMPAGQAQEHHEDRADGPARASGARRRPVRVRKSGQVRLDVYHADALAQTIPALPIPRKPCPAAVVAGRIEDGQPWLIRLPDTHLFIFIAGATGSGKAAPRRPPAGQLPAARTGIVECPGRAYQGRVHAADHAERATMPPSAKSLRACWEWECADPPERA